MDFTFSREPWPTGPQPLELGARGLWSRVVALCPPRHTPGRSPVFHDDGRLSGVQQLLPVALSLQVNDLRFATPPGGSGVRRAWRPLFLLPLHPPPAYSKEEAKNFLTLSSWVNSTPQSPGISSTRQPSPPCSTSHQPSKSSVGTRQTHRSHPVPAEGVAALALAPVVGAGRKGT